MFFVVWVFGLCLKGVLVTVAGWLMLGFIYLCVDADWLLFLLGVNGRLFDAGLVDGWFGVVLFLLFELICC